MAVPSDHLVRTLEYLKAEIAERESELEKLRGTYTVLSSFFGTENGNGRTVTSQIAPQPSARQKRKKRFRAEDGRSVMTHMLEVIEKGRAMSAGEVCAALRARGIKPRKQTVYTRLGELVNGGQLTAEGLSGKRRYART